MKIVLLGYMSSGKSSAGKLLARQLQYKFIDLDQYISEQTQMSISNIFAKKGELFFRKLEHKCLKEVLNRSKDEQIIIALGGGTPCYYNNMDIINEKDNVTSIYLKVNIENLFNRLWREKENRPLIAHYSDKEGLEEFIRKHLFERQFYYLQAKHNIEVSELNIEEVAETIRMKINQ